MTSPYVAGLRSVALNLPDLERAEQFYTATWNLDLVARTADALYLRGTGSVHHILSLHRAEAPSIRNVTFAARSTEALNKLAAAAPGMGGRVISPVMANAEPDGGVSLTLADRDGRIFRFIHGDAVHPDAGPRRDRPVRLAHVVLNSADVAATQAFFEQVMGFTLSDRTEAMAFMRCNSDHHSAAIGVADRNSLNHIAFMMPELDSVMRGSGRMKDAGFPIEWGPGRHGPGNNAFGYFVDPFGFVIEYTAEVQTVDDSHRAGSPADWKWPPGRVDQWGISPPPTARLKDAQKQIFFAAAPGAR